MIIAFKPLIPLLPDEGSIMSSLQRALMIYNSKEGIPIVSDEINEMVLFFLEVNTMFKSL